MFLASATQVSIGLAMLRLSIGCFMLIHGIQKIMNFGSLSAVFPDPLGLGSQLSLILAIAAEVGCSVLLILGLGTRVAVLPLAFTMVVALFFVHAADPWKIKELAAVYLAMYAVIFVTGPGDFSLDKKWFGKHARENEIV